MISKFMTTPAPIIEEIVSTELETRYCELNLNQHINPGHVQSNCVWPNNFQSIYNKSVF